MQNGKTLRHLANILKFKIMKSSETLSSRVALYPGSFDPIHNGHLHIIRRALRLFDKVYVAVAKNPQKNPLFSPEERMEMLRDVFAGTPKIEPVLIEGLTVDNAVRLGAGVIVRGLRLVSDFESELLLDMHNRRLESRVETIYMMPTQEFLYFNSSFVKQIVCLDVSRVDGYVPAPVLERLKKKFSGGTATRERG